MFHPIHVFQSDTAALSERFGISVSQLNRWAKNAPLKAKMFDLAFVSLEKGVPEASNVFEKKFGTSHSDLSKLVGFNDNIFYMDGIIPVIGTTLRTWSTQEDKWPLFCAAIVGTHSMIFEKIQEQLTNNLTELLEVARITRADIVSLFLTRPDATLSLLKALDTIEASHLHTKQQQG
ncbi:hypothetical protein [Vibrio sp. Hal054]|uniref:hypothetical protein n=1 Tax=Vibrio sp. Hal054 TaxID=3035158 RepID=UPI00301D29B4